MVSESQRENYLQNDPGELARFSVFAYIQLDSMDIRFDLLDNARNGSLLWSCVTSLTD